MKNLIFKINIGLLTLGFGLAAGAQINSNAKSVTVISDQKRVVGKGISQSMVAEGGVHGGGGDYLVEGRIDQIRADILMWLDSKGPNKLVLPQGLSADVYKKQMKAWLAPGVVVISSITKEESDKATSPEQKVIVDGVNKTCRGFISTTDGRPHILCEAYKFMATPAADQYRLIHHEYAGLSRVEKNVGAASDYQISNQLTDFLVEEKIIRLGVFKKQYTTPTLLYSGVVAQVIIDALKDMKVSGVSDGKGRIVYHIKNFEYSNQTDGCVDGAAMTSISYQDVNGPNYKFDSCYASEGDEIKGKALWSIFYDLGSEVSESWTSGIYVDNIECTAYAQGGGSCYVNYTSTLK